MPARICPTCGKHHNHTSQKCTSCYEEERQRPGRKHNRRPYAPPKCGDGKCGEPATETRLVTVGIHGSTSDEGWLFLCPDCASLFDQLEQRPTAPITIPSRAAVRGSIYC
jgi:hypothetical protein